MRIYFILLSLLLANLSFAQTRTHPGGPDPQDFKRCPDILSVVDSLHVKYLKANKKNYKEAKDELERMIQFEKFINSQSLKLTLDKFNKEGSLCECDKAPSAKENIETLEQIISIYEGNKRCLEFNTKDDLVKQMKEVLKHERKD